MGFIVGRCRNQRTLFPEALDELIEAEHPIRVIDAFVEGLNLSELGFNRTEAAATGRPPYHPGDLLKLYIFGYFNQIRSSRKLEQECKRNIEVMWLLNRLSPDFKTIANFRHEHSAALKQTCRVFVLMLKSLNLVSGELVAIDGTKFQAVASTERVLTQVQAKREIAKVDERINSYLSELDQMDEQESNNEVDAQAVRAALELLQSKKAQLLSRQESMQTQDRNQDVQGEDEARLMKMPEGVIKAGYNVQTAVDSKHQIIIYHEVTNEAFDKNLLVPIAKAGKEILGQEKLTIVADKGYSNSRHFAQCEELNITAYVSPQRGDPRPERERYFNKSAFIYDWTTDSYRCPAGKTLRRNGFHHRHKQWHYNTKACKTCSIRNACTSGQRRTLTRHLYEAQFEAAQRRIEANPEMMRRRRAIVELPYAHLKYRIFGRARFLLRGLIGASAEMAIGVLAYNLKRAINLLGVSAFLKAMAI